MQAAYGLGYELTTAALAVSILDRFTATQYIKVSQPCDESPETETSLQRRIEAMLS